MQQAVTNSKLVIRRPGAEPGELPLSGDVSIGRAFDNLIAIEDNSVSRYHAVVEVRPDGVWLCDLGSVNGTVLNGRTIKSECRLKNGDSISFGGVRVECRLQDYPDGPYLAAPQGGVERDRTRKAGNSLPRGADTSTEPRGSASARFSDWAAGNRAALIVLAIVVPVFAIVVAAAILTGALSRSGGSLDAIHIVGVKNGDTISKPTIVRTDVNTTNAVLEVIYQLDDVELARTKTPPYSAEINPEQLLATRPDLAASTHVLSLIVEDKNGNQAVQPAKVIVSFRRPDEAGAEGGGSATSGGTDNAAASGTEAGSAGVNANDVAYLADALARQISKKNQLFAPEFVQAILQRTNEYRFDFAGGVRGSNPHEIANAFNNRGIDPMVGFVLAMSRGKFSANSNGQGGQGSGLWRLPPGVVKAFGPKSDPETPMDSKRSAEIAAEYTKSLMGLFESEDFMYGIGCFGMTISQAGEIRARLHQQVSAEDRRDFWKAAQSGVLPRESIDQVVSFFAAGIVAEYPDKFGLHCAPLSSLYY